MQKLLFESAWEKTISKADRMFIEEVFKQDLPISERIKLSPIWIAQNHKGEWLVTVLIHNRTKTSLPIHDKKLSIYMNNEFIIEHIFTISKFEVEPFTSTPWTFIFPNNEFLEQKFKKNKRNDLTLCTQITITF